MKKTARGRKNAGERPDPLIESQPGTGVGSSREEIARRAYEIYLARGDGDRDAVADWLQAEEELRQGGMR